MIQQTTATQATSGACVVCHHPTGHYDWCMLAGQDMNETDPPERDCQQDSQADQAAASYITTLRTLLVKAEQLIYSTEQTRDQIAVCSLVHGGADASATVAIMHSVTATDRASSLYDYVEGLAKAAGINPDTAEQDQAGLRPGERVRFEVEGEMQEGWYVGRWTEVSSRVTLEAPEGWPVGGDGVARPNTYIRGDYEIQAHA